MIRAALAVVAALALVACDGDIPNVYPVTSQTPVVHGQDAGALAIAHGAAFAVQSFMGHEEIEGSSALPVTSIRSADPETVAVVPTSHAYTTDDYSPNGYTWILIGVTPGSTTLHLYRDDDEVGTVAVDVVEQVP